MSGLKLLAVFLLGVVIAFGLIGRKTTYLVKFASVISVLLTAIVAIHAALGDSPIELLSLELPSKSSAAVFLCYSGYVGIAFALINATIRRDDGK